MNSSEIVAKTVCILTTIAALVMPELVTAQDVPAPSTKHHIKYSPYLKDDYPKR